MSANRLSLTLLPLVAAAPRALPGEEWEAALQYALVAEHSQTRRDGLKGVDASTLKGLRALWKVLSLRDPLKFDWFVRKGAQEAIMNAKGEEAEKEIDRVLGVGSGPASSKGSGKGTTAVKEGATSGGGGGSAAEDELVREAIVYGIIEKIREAVVRKNAGNDDRLIAEFRYQVRKKRGVEYFELVLPAIREFDPEKKQLLRLQTALNDKSPRVRRAAITGLVTHPDSSSIPLLVESLKKLEKGKAKSYREWVLTRHALETLTGQYLRDDVQAWTRWWELMKGTFSIEKRVEEEKGEDEAGKGKTVVVTKDAVQVTLNMKVAGREDGYPLLVLPLEEMEVDYFRPYFHGIEDFCRVYYLRMPRIEDFKGLARDPKSNLVNYPTRTLARALVDIMKEEALDKLGVLAHGPDSSVLAMMFMAENPDTVSHLVLMNPRSSGEAYRQCLQNVRKEGTRLRNQEIIKGVDNLLLKEDGNPTYMPADDAEAGGMGRAINNLRHVDPSEPEAGMLRELYGLPGGVSGMYDTSWSAKKILAGLRADLPVLVIMCEKAHWTPIPDQQAVAAVFKRPTVVKMAESADYPFISETYAFTKHLEAFFKPAIQARKAKEAKAKEKERKDAEKAEKDAARKEKAKGKGKGPEKEKGKE
ncbi:MAG: hypothetical protein HY721_31465 [Planctomycetes bacterium]|nr:hypothetical protein [Planctomycetota bacterium]